MPSKKKKSDKVRMPEEFKRAIEEGVPTEAEHIVAVEETKGLDGIDVFMKTGEAPYFPEE